jgi:hypothetical protein
MITGIIPAMMSAVITSMTDLTSTTAYRHRFQNDPQVALRQHPERA